MIRSRSDTVKSSEGVRDSSLFVVVLVSLQPYRPHHSALLSLSATLLPLHSIISSAWTSSDGGTPHSQEARSTPAVSFDHLFGTR
jgi:hypothetical protein